MLLGPLPPFSPMHLPFLPTLETPRRKIPMPPTTMLHLPDHPSTISTSSIISEGDFPSLPRQSSQNARVQCENPQQEEPSQTNSSGINQDTLTKFCDNLKKEFTDMLKNESQESDSTRNGRHAGGYEQSINQTAHDGRKYLR
jgi:hypothetical protein